MLDCMFLDIICFDKRIVFRGEKNCAFEEHIIFKAKYPSIFSPQMEAIVFHIIQILNTYKFENWRIFSEYSPFLAGEYSVT